MTADNDNMGAEHRHSKRAQLMRFNKMEVRRSKVGESLTQEATIVQFDWRGRNDGPTFSQGQGKAVLRCRSKKNQGS